MLHLPATQYTNCQEGFGFINSSTSFLVILRPPDTTVSRWRLDKVDWDLFKGLAKVDRSIEEFPSVDEVDEYLASLLQWAGHCSITWTSGRVACWPVLWWSEECRQAVVEWRRAYGRYWCHRAEFYHVAYKQATAQACRVLKICSSPVWKSVQKIAVLRANDGSSVTTPQEVAELFGTAFAGVFMAARSPEFKRVCRVEKSQALDFGVGHVAEHRMQFTLDKVSHWTTGHGFRFSRLRTIAMHFCHL
ncbi:putative RNA-directed DNA polymerase from mobile element jockey-like 101, partial [Homarus americanus]